MTESPPELSRVLALAQDGDWDGAARALRARLEAAPDDPETLCWLGVAETELGMDGIAHERFRRCLAQDPTDPLILSTVGTALARVDDPAAEGALRTAALLGPEIASARAAYGAYLAREGQVETALEELEAARALAPGDSAVQASLGVALALAGQSEPAIQAWETAAGLEPGEGWVRVLLGLEYLVEDRMQEAAAALDHAARLEQDDLEVQVLAALAAHHVGSLDTAALRVEHARGLAGEEDEGLMDEVDLAVEGSAQDAQALLTDLGATARRRRLHQG